MNVESEQDKQDAKERGVHLALLKVKGFIESSYANESVDRQKTLYMLFGLNIGLVVGTRDIHTARLFMNAILASDTGLVENVSDEIMRVLEQ